MFFKKKQLLTVLFCFSLFYVVGQNLNSTSHKYFRGENGEIINRVDSLSFSPLYIYSEYYVDSISKTPYSGIIIIKRNSFISDSLCVYNGVLDGFSKTYNFQEYLFNTKFISQHYKYTLFNSYNDRRFRYKDIRFYETNDIDVNFDLIYKKRNTIVKLVKTNYETNKKQRKRMKFNSLVELETYFKSKNYVFFDKCKEMGFFDNEIHIPILKGNCN